MPLIAPRPWRLRLFADHNLTTVLPELTTLQSFVEHSDWHNDTPFAQSVRLHDWIRALPTSLLQTVPLPTDALASFLNHPIEANEPHTCQALLAFVALIHDVGKATTYQQNPDGTTRCPEHEIVSGRMAHAICARFDFTPAESHWITALVRHHGEPYALYKQLSSLPPTEQETLWAQFTKTHQDILRPLLILAYGDLVTSHMAMINPAKYAAVLHFYQSGLHLLWPTPA